jgi:cysteinyl-tRNA synthetase
MEEIARRYIESYERAVSELMCLPPTYQPRVTEFIPEIIRFIEGLIEKGVAYEVEGAVFFDVNRFPEYGKLSHHSPEELLYGHRIEVDPRKKNPLDFALWKDSRPGEPGWESPWGRGRPGWHIECSVMASHYAEGTLDLHGGGLDLIFPHHENEIAQYEALYGREFARHWMHNGFIRIRSQKMSKSLKNYVTVAELLAIWPREVIRYFLLSAHYRSPLDFTPEALVESAKSLFRLYEFFEPLWIPASERSSHLPFEDLTRRVLTAREGLIHALLHDLNTPQALAQIFSQVREVNRFKELRFFGIPRDRGGSSFRDALASLYNNLQELLGLLPRPYPDFLKEWNVSGLDLLKRDPQEIATLLKEREEFRRKGNFEEADRIRSQLFKLGIEVEDHPSSVRYRLKPEARLNTIS